MDDLEQKVKKIIAEQLGKDVEDIKNEASFIEDLGKMPSRFRFPTSSRKTCARFSRQSTSFAPIRKRKVALTTFCISQKRALT